MQWLSRLLSMVNCFLEINIPIGGNYNDKRAMQGNPNAATGSRITSCRANKKLPWAVVHGPYKKQGLQIPNLHMEQTILSQIRALLWHNRAQNLTRFLIQACCKAIWIESGSSGNLFDIPEACEPLLTESWIKPIWQECHHHKIRIHSNTKEVEPQWEGDTENASNPQTRVPYARTPNDK